MAERARHDQACEWARRGDPARCTCARYCVLCGADEWSDDPHEDECPRRTTEPTVCESFPKPYPVHVNEANAPDRARRLARRSEHPKTRKTR